MKYPARFASLLAIPLLAALLASCDFSDSDMSAIYTSNQPKTPTRLIKYSRTGGGEHDLIIADSGSFWNVQSYVGYPADSLAFVLQVAKSTTSAADSGMLARLFAGQQTISGTLYESKTKLGGSWIDVYIRVDTSWVRVGNQAVLDELKSFEFQVDSLAAVTF
jgi:hypothetical protein